MKPKEYMKLFEKQVKKQKIAENIKNFKKILKY